MLSGAEGRADALEHQFRSLGVPQAQIRWQRPIAPPERWRAAAVTMRRPRGVATAAFGPCRHLHRRPGGILIRGRERSRA